MPRGGKRTPTEGKKLGRPKQQRIADASFWRKLKAQVKAEKLWIFAAHEAYEKAKRTGNTGDLVRILEYWDDRDFGRCVDTVNHLHDKPIEHTVTVTIAEVIRKVRERKEQYERSR